MNKIALDFFPKGRINNIPALVQMMAWRRRGDKPLYEPIMVSLLTLICVTRPQWVNNNEPFSKILVFIKIVIINPYEILSDSNITGAEYENPQFRLFIRYITFVINTTCKKKIHVVFVNAAWLTAKVQWTPFMNLPPGWEAFSIQSWDFLTLILNLFCAQNFSM